jgi:hypothetical protein
MRLFTTGPQVTERLYLPWFITSWGTARHLDRIGIPLRYSWGCGAKAARRSLDKASPRTLDLSGCHDCQHLRCLFCKEWSRIMSKLRFNWRSSHHPAEWRSSGDQELILEVTSHRRSLGQSHPSGRHAPSYDWLGTEILVNVKRP